MLQERFPARSTSFPTRSSAKATWKSTIDREKAARYGVNVGDIQDVIEVALGGKTITTTVEGRERFPVRVRYARALREDEEQVKNLLVSAARRRDAGRAARCHAAGSGAAEHAGAAARTDHAADDPSPCKSRSARSPTCGSSKARR